MDESLKSFVHARLLRARPDVDYRNIDAYVASPEFKGLEKTFDVNLLKALDKFLARRQPAPAAVPAPPPVAEALPWQPPPLQAQADTPAALAAPAADVPGPAAPPSSAPPGPVNAARVAEAYAPPPQQQQQQQQPEDRLASMAPDLRYAAQAGGFGTPAAPTPALPATQSALSPPDLQDIAFRLPNARAGSAYSQRLVPGDSAEAVVFDAIVMPEGLPMSADPATGAVTGTPPAAGDYEITVDYHFARQSPSRRRRAQVALAVAPDPRTMWENRPSDRIGPYWKEDEQCGCVRGPDRTILAASKRGRSHAHVGSFRDDDYRIEHVADSGWYVAVVADGAGYARYSRRGAAIICEEAKNRILASLTGITAEQIDKSALAHAQARDDQAAREELHTHLSRIVGNAAYWAVRAIHDEVAKRTDLGGVFKDYSSTALIAICKRYPFGTLCAAYWVGDGAVGVYSERDGIILLGDVDSGEFSGQTRFLDNTMVDHEVLRKRTRFAIVGDMKALVLMTDGVSDAKFETEARLARAADWHAFWDELDQAVSFAAPDTERERRLLDWLDFWSQGNHDDRTIAVIY